MRYTVSIMLKLLFILITTIMVAGYFVQNPDKLPWFATEGAPSEGYMVYTYSECRNLDCSVVSEYKTPEECRARIEKIFNERKANPTIDFFGDRAYCYSGCYRRTNGKLYGLEEGICKVADEIDIKSFLR